MILTTEQARAVYDAMCALNNVHSSLGGLSLEFYRNYSERIRISESLRGVVVVEVVGVESEQHSSQAAFATAYGLQ